MGLERRGRADQGQLGANPPGEELRARPRPEVKPFEIGKRLIVEAWEKVRVNQGAPGVDAVSIGLFEEQLKDNLPFFAHGGGRNWVKFPVRCGRVAGWGCCRVVAGVWWRGQRRVARMDAGCP